MTSGHGEGSWSAADGGDGDVVDTGPAGAPGC